MNARPTADERTVSWLSTYIELTKPRIVELLLVTTLPAMVVADRGWPGMWLVAVTLVGGSLAAGGANVINQVLDRDIDGIMARTRGRPLPTGRVSTRAATIFGVLLGVAGFVVLWIGTTLLAGVLSLVAFGFYIVVYTIVLKRSSTQNIVIGGAAGAVPALIGWAAVTGGLSTTSWVMFTIVLLWTPPHFWSLSLKYSDQYRAAGVPMFPVVAGPRPTHDQILWYSMATVGVTLILVPVAGLGWIYTVVAVASAIPMVMFPLRVRAERMASMQYFGFTNVYLAAVFLSMMIDRIALDGEVAGAWSLAGAGTALVIAGLIGASTVETRPAVRARGVSAVRHGVEVGITMAFAVGVLVAAWGAFVS